MIKRLIFVLNLIFFLVCNVSGLEVVPFVHSYDPVNDGDTFQLYIKNKTNDLIAFEIYIQSRKQNADGSDELTRDDDSFAVFPSQIIIPPNSSRIVKVKWLGNDVFTKNKALEQAFRVRLDQYPVNLEAKKLLSDVAGRTSSSIDIRLSIGTSLYISPKGSVPLLKVVGSTATTVTVKNTGTQRTSIAEYREKITVNDRDLKDIVRKEDLDAVILAGSTRIFQRKKK